MNPFDEHYVYRAIDADGTVLYVGCTHDVTARMRAHRQSSPWRDRLDSVRVTRHENRAVALRVESFEIRVWQPNWNVQGKPILDADAVERVAAMVAADTTAQAVATRLRIPLSLAKDLFSSGEVPVFYARLASVSNTLTVGDLRPSSSRLHMASA